MSRLCFHGLFGLSAATDRRTLNDRFFDALERIAGEKQLVFFGPFTMVGDRKGGILGKLEISVSFSQAVDAENVVHLAYVGVLREDRGKGYGARLMTMIMQAADAVGLPVELEVDPQREPGEAKPPMDKKQLRAFYGRFGFKTVRGMGSDFMRRPAGGAR